MVTDPQEVARIKEKILEQENLERDTKQENRAKHKTAPTTLKYARNADRKQKSNYPSRLQHNPRPRENGPRSEEYEPGTVLSECGFQKDGVSKKKRFCLRYPPESETKQNDLGEELVLWAQQTESMQIEDFPVKAGIAPKYFFQLASKNQYFKDCLDVARHYIGSKIFHGVANKQIDRSLPSHVYPLYNQQYNDYMKEKEANQSAVKTEIKTVEIPASPSSDMVPDNTDSE